MSDMSEAEWRGALAATLQTAQSCAGNNNAVLIVLFAELLSSCMASRLDPRHTDSAVARMQAELAAQVREKQRILRSYNLIHGDDHVH
jgi:hypothetical protein